jgi:hypothetical protein
MYYTRNPFQVLSAWTRELAFAGFANWTIQDELRRVRCPALALPAIASLRLLDRIRQPRSRYDSDLDRLNARGSFEATIELAR